MTVDRALLRAPFEGMRQTLTEAGIDIPQTPPFVVDQVRAAWRFDLSALGLDTTDTGQLAGALAGLAMGLKNASQLLPDLPVGFYVPWVRLFDILEPILDDPTPWAGKPLGPPTTVRTPWGDLPGFDLTGVAEQLTQGQSAQRFDLNDTEAMRRLIAEHSQMAPAPRLGGPGFDRGADEQAVLEAAQQATRAANEAKAAVEALMRRPWWQKIRDAYRKGRNR